MVMKKKSMYDTKIYEREFRREIWNGHNHTNIVEIGEKRENNEINRKKKKYIFYVDLLIYFVFIENAKEILIFFSKFSCSK